VSFAPGEFETFPADVVTPMFPPQQPGGRAHLPIVSGDAEGGEADAGADDDADDAPEPEPPAAATPAPQPEPDEPDADGGPDADALRDPDDSDPQTP
jgi:hypothetical protein